jgi:RNA-directed DNA polymerase
MGGRTVVKLELHPDKTRLIEFGRYAVVNRKECGAGKPETFNFLGFTHICRQTWKTGKFLVLRKTTHERLSAKLGALKEELRRRFEDADICPWQSSGNG